MGGVGTDNWFYLAKSVPCKPLQAWEGHDCGWLCHFHVLPVLSLNPVQPAVRTQGCLVPMYR